MGCSVAASFGPNAMGTRWKRDANPIVIEVSSGSDRVRIAFGVEEVTLEMLAKGYPLSCPQANDSSPALAF
jgi:hypothetical protein